MELRLVLNLLLNTALVAVVNSQIPLPRRPLGFIYKEGEPSAPIHLTAFVDLTCPDSQEAWPTVKKVADMYGPETIQFTVQLFPLPYHTNAFIAAQVSRIVLNKANSYRLLSKLTGLIVTSCSWRRHLNDFNRLRRCKRMHENRT